MNALSGLVKRLQQNLDHARKNTDPAASAAAWRQVLEEFHAVSRQRPDPEPEFGDESYGELWALAGQAMANLGGQGQFAPATLDHYDHTTYGPMLGVSDEGSATAAIRHGAYASPKGVVLTTKTPLTIGVAHDAERLGAVGEVVVGPDEFSRIRLACAGRILTTTNVGTRVNVRNYLTPPVVSIQPGAVDRILRRAVQALTQHFAPFRRTPSGKPRSRTVLVQFDHRVPRAQRLSLFDRLQQAVAGGAFCEPRVHRLGLLVKMSRWPKRSEQVKQAVDFAKACGLQEVSLDGPLLRAAQEAISLPGLLNVFEAEELAEVFRYASAEGVKVHAKERVDPATTVRHVWTGLSVARNMGLELGKYGLAPLTFAEQREVIVRIQYWFQNWCAAPVCYVDYPIVTSTDVYHGPRLAQGIRGWLSMAGKQKVRVVLIDTANKWEGRRLVKESPDDVKGFLDMKEIASLNDFAVRQGIKTLWAGGLGVPQAFEFGKLAVFGIYVTSAAASLERLERRYIRDPYLAGMREPQPKAVTRVKLLLEAGFLVSQLNHQGRTNEAADLETGARCLIAALPGNDSQAIEGLEVALHAQAVAAWKMHLHDR